jgi:hypothetical protein
VKGRGEEQKAKTERKKSIPRVIPREDARLLIPPSHSQKLKFFSQVISRGLRLKYSFRIHEQSLRVSKYEI